MVEPSINPEGVAMMKQVMDNVIARAKEESARSREAYIKRRAEREAHPPDYSAGFIRRMSSTMSNPRTPEEWAEAKADAEQRAMALAESLTPQERINLYKGLVYGIMPEIE